MKDFPVRHFVPRTAFDPKEYISVNIAITVIFNLNINHVYIYKGQYTYVQFDLKFEW